MRFMLLLQWHYRVRTTGPNQYVEFNKANKTFFPLLGMAVEIPCSNLIALAMHSMFVFAIERGKKLQPIVCSIAFGIETCLWSKIHNL